jgi:hypothetical protein
VTANILGELGSAGAVEVHQRNEFIVATPEEYVSNAEPFLYSLCELAQCFVGCALTVSASCLFELNDVDEQKRQWRIPDGFGFNTLK